MNLDLKKCVFCLPFFKLGNYILIFICFIEITNDPNSVRNKSFKYNLRNLRNEGFLARVPTEKQN